MEIMKTRSSLILSGYFITASILLLDCTDNFPGTTFLRKIKYVFLLLLIADFVFSNAKKVSKSTIVVTVFLILHTVIFGLIYVNPTVRELTRIHFQEMIIYLFVLFFLVCAVERYNCRLEFIETTCTVFSVFMLWCGLTHLSNFVNPLYFVYVFSRSARIRSSFGTGSPNYMGYYCFIALVFFYALWYEYRQDKKHTQKRKYMLFGISCWTAVILFSTGSRSSIISFMIFAALCFYKLYLEKYFGESKYIFVIAAFVTVALFVYVNWSSIWGNANRDANISVNIPVFNRMNALWKGMGYIESSGFYKDAYGYDTWPVDIYYLYIYLSTGVIGSVIMAVPLLYILYNLIKSKDTFIRYVMFPAYVAILFDGFWQVNIFTYRYVATLFIGVLLLVSISLPDRKIC